MPSTLDAKRKEVKRTKKKKTKKERREEKTGSIRMDFIDFALSSLVVVVVPRIV